MKPAAKVLVALGLWLPIAASQARPGTARTERLAALGKLWASVKYFHPFLAYKDINWDAALLAALPKAAAARDAEEYARAVGSMLSTLSDPATGVVRRAAPAAEPSTSVSQVRNGVLVITVRPETAALVRAAGAAIGEAKGVVFDLRHHEA